MLLVLDVGNTNTVLGIYDGTVLKHHFRISTNRSATGDELCELLLSLIERRGVNPKSIEGSVLASVVPPLNRIVVDALQFAFGNPPVVVGPGTKTGMPILIDNPVEVGADRIVNAVAAWARHKQALIVVDFGTGTNLDVVTAKGEYVGGAIAPGLDISMDALFTRAAKLPRVELKKPPKAIGKNTIHALQSGLLYGYAGLVDALVERMKAELSSAPDGSDVKVIATGGLAFLFEGVSRTIQSFDEMLTLDGLRLIWELNAAHTTPSASRK
ncbi:MAG TPA: type III pantothenate kinase [Myxococcota bacterium]|jgi:type III pantothenate kinase